MKKFILLLLGFSIFGFASAQHFGLQAGAVFSNMKMETNLLSLKTDFKPGFMVGATVDFPLNNKMVINTSLQYRTLGTSIADGPWIDETTETIIIKTDNLALDFTYAYLFDLSSIQLFAEGGGYVGYALGGKTIYSPKEGDNETETLKIGSDKTDDLKAFDAGLIIGAGVYVNKFKFGLGYQHGLSNLSTSEDASDEIANRMIYIKAAYFFNRK